MRAKAAAFLGREFAFDGKASQRTAELVRRLTSGK
jgi:hypothetical protein